MTGVTIDLRHKADTREVAKTVDAKERLALVGQAVDAYRRRIAVLISTAFASFLGGRKDEPRREAEAEQRERARFRDRRTPLPVTPVLEPSPVGESVLRNELGLIVTDSNPKPGFVPARPLDKVRGTPQ